MLHKRTRPFVRPILRQAGVPEGEALRDACSARALASFASYADQLLSHTEIVSCGPERHSDLSKAETS
ncbi:hypothetical protein SBA7_500012 [Candidatus Sulfotelmatobacter sp. SbA7]|nr:hypothetical protein SBA7_500012 [Candidatus Sulfotelmatobacter sp. SbA7]